VPRPGAVRPVRLTALGGPSGTLHGPDVAVTGVTSGSEYVRPGDLFAALPGSTTHGARFAAAAVAAGAVAVLTDAAGRAAVPAGTPVLEVPEPRAVLGAIAAQVYGEPSRAMRVLGVTGTSGKTTTTFLVEAGLQAAGRTTGLVGTVATHVGTRTLTTGFTTPEAPELQALFAVMREHGVTDVAMEVSSHALALGRVGGTRFAAAGFTNLSEDHLDFHGDMASYFAAKASLFTPAYTERSVVVTDDESGARLAAQTPGAATVSTTGAPATWQARDIAERAGGGTSFTAVGPDGAVAAGCAIPGRYNVANVLLALALLDAAGVPPQVAAPALATATVPGRMEPVDAGQPFLAVVDYSHKPAAVDGALRALRPLTSGRLIVVLGCGGDRDRGKRPHMGEIAARGADVLIVTDDNPRSEDPAAIRSAMLAGARAVPAAERGEIVEIGDRGAAIAHAVGLARAGDTVLVAGKGHEPGQEVAGVVHPFDDRDVLRDALAAAS
jgi:UDP-N-acetylmuramoyl-L-alanyl-D-glutamate--2,6-diaminopimelate ligase